MESLAEFISRIMVEKRFSSYDVMRAAGKGVTQGNLSRIANGLTKNPSTVTLKALAKGLFISEEEIFAVARGVSMEPTNFQKKIEALFYGSETWTTEQQELVYQAVDLIVTGMKNQR